MPVSRNTLWDVICRSASSFVEVGHAGKTLFLPVSLTNLRKRRFAAGALTGELPVLVLPLDGRLDQMGSNAMRVLLAAWNGHDMLPKWLRKRSVCETSSSPPRKRNA